MSLKRVMVLGSEGLIGAEIVAIFLAHDFTVFASSHSDLDVLDSKKLSELIQDFAPDLIVNCVGKVGGVQHNLKNPADLLMANVSLGLSIIDAALANSVPHVIQFAPACMYPMAQDQDYSEEDLCMGPVEPSSSSYAYSKMLLTQAFDAIRAQYGLKWITIVPSNVFGKNDWRHGDGGHAISMITSRMLMGQSRQVEIWGDGSATRDFISSEEVAGATMFIVKSELFEKSVINVASGASISIKGLVDKLKLYTNFQGEIMFDKGMPSGAMKKTLNSEWLRARGWKPRKTIDQSLKEYVENYKAYLEQS